ncbi:Gnt-I system high-affinity gluconate transporter [Pedobacter steynii]|uniref:Gnt-I system high-affinity gluconate transporter n=1 Tax=Pedobacter steynii TaxID=430522 RepID=A0A1H0IBT3_9SPHI|nr:gluconate:H+ symporter [Pedobacter steynii]NQX42857.1 gluconate transporter [Pedobacter steynii]SDO28887.1 Gnt-I system high-affinity gluconate transporter [Pedobacter steynii]
MTVLIVVGCILLLVLLTTWGKINAFIAFLFVSILAGLLLGVPLTGITKSVQKGVGDILGSLIIVIVFGAMLGKLVAASGAAQKIASVMMKIFGRKYIQWGLMTTGFIIGIPLFYNVGFVLMVPLIFSVVYKYKLPAVYLGLPMLAALSVTHGFLPPHPSPAALVLQFHANMGLTMFYGIMLAIPAIIIAGPVYSKTLKNIVAVPLKTFQSDDLPGEKLPGTWNSFISALLPVIVMALTTICVLLFKDNPSVTGFAGFLAEPSIVMFLTLCLTTFTLGIKMGKSMKEVMSIYGDAVKDIAMILLIIGGSGALKQVLSDSGVSKEIGDVLAGLSIEPLFLGWLIAAVIRVCLGSATVAGLTAAGIIAPLMVNSNVNPELMVLSIGAGSLMFSHVNDPGFWMFKEYFNLGIKDTIRSWSIMETLVAVIGLIGVLILDQIV